MSSWASLIRTVGSVIAIGAALVVVINQLVSGGVLAEPDSFQYYCGLCHVDWKPAASLLIIGGLVGVISIVARSGVAPTRFRGDDDE